MPNKILKIDGRDRRLLIYAGGVLRMKHVRIKEMEAGEVEGIPYEQVKKDLEEKFGPFDEEEY